MAKMFIAGESVDSVTGETYVVLNPASGAEVDSAPRGNADDVRRAVDAAQAAFEAWSHTAAEERAKILVKAAALVEGERKSLAEMLTREQGKPLLEASTEIDHFLHGIDFYAGLASNIPRAPVPFPPQNAIDMALPQP